MKLTSKQLEEKIDLKNSKYTHNFANIVWAYRAKQRDLIIYNGVL